MKLWLGEGGPRLDRWHRFHSLRTFCTFIVLFGLVVFKTDINCRRVPLTTSHSRKGTERGFAPNTVVHHLACRLSVAG